MAEVTVTLIGELRERTGAAIMDCKKALDATSGDIEPAVDWLLQQLKSGDPSASFTSKLLEVAYKRGDADAAAILEDMRYYRATNIAELLPHYGSSKSFNWKRATLRAISGFLLDGEVRGSNDETVKLANPSQMHPVIVFIHFAWTNRAAGYWLALRAAATATGLPFSAACIDLSEPANNGWLKAHRAVFERERVPLEELKKPSAHVRLSDRTEHFDLYRLEDIPGQVGEILRASEQHQGPSSHFIKDVTAANFIAEVVDGSSDTPVIVDFWAPWCDPCKQLAPILEKLVRAARGPFGWLGSMSTRTRRSHNS